METAKTCDTCAFWGVNRDDGEWGDIFHPIDPDEYAPMIMPFDVHKCDSPKLTFFERPVEPDGATMIDGSVYFAGLVTGPKFFCPNWAIDERADDNG